MAKIFEQFHFSLIEREQSELFEPSLKREQWLRQKLGERIDFYHAGKPFHWVPQDYSDELICAVIERERVHTVRTPPDKGAEETEDTYYTGSLVIVDPADHPDGQRVSVQQDQHVGQPSAMLTSLLKHLNIRSEHQYALHFKALFKSDNFWKFADKHGGQLAFVRFRFTVPNMIFGAGGKTKDGLRRIGEDTDAQEIDLRLDSDDGVKADSTAVREGLAYGEEGNAKVTAKALNGDRWSSTTEKLTVKMPRILNFVEATKDEAQAWLNQALGRGEDSDDPGFDNPDNWDRDK